jgi:O-antigen ligase
MAELIFLSMLLMIAALFTSRALLSIGTILFLAFTCVHKESAAQFRFFLRQPMLVGITLLFFIPFLSGFWSEDREVWARFARIKLPLLLLPLAFAGNWRLSTIQWRILAGFFLFMVLAGCCWSTWQYLQNVQAIHKGYLAAKVIDTPLGNDHVRFSLVVSIGVICAAILLKQSVEKHWRWVLGILIVFFIVYLHVLSARTGLIGLYIFLTMLFFYLVFLKRKSRWISIICGFIIVMPLAAWFFLPTFQNRIRYIIYDFSFIRSSTYLPGANDGNRIISLRAGWNILREHPWGVGIGDVFHKTNEWYSEFIPGMLETDKLYPSSEWLMYGTAAGWPGLILFTIIMVIPFFQSGLRERFFWIALNAVMAFSFLFDIGLEVQFGVFIYAFLLLWWRKWLGQVQPAKTIARS